MYERFTDRARKAMQLANQEAQRLNHEYIGTEHVLIGIVKEGSGVAATILKDHGVAPDHLIKKVREQIQPGPVMVTMGKLPQTPRVKQAIQYAVEEARSLNQGFLDTGHLLVGLLRAGDGKEHVAGWVLECVGVTLEKVRQAIMEQQREYAPNSPETETWYVCYTFSRHPITESQRQRIQAIVDESRAEKSELAKPQSESTWRDRSPLL